MNALLIWLVYVAGMLIIYHLQKDNQLPILWVLMWILFELLKIEEKLN